MSSGLLMLCCALMGCECITMGHGVCGNMGNSDTMNAGFIDRVINSFLVSGQCSVMTTTKHAEV